MAHPFLQGNLARWGLALWMAAIMAAAPMVATARAQALDNGPPTTLSSAGPGAADAPGDPNRWWGALGAVICGLEIRFALRVPAIGLNPYAIAAGLSGCLLAALDVCRH